MTLGTTQLIEIGGSAVEGVYYSTMFDVKADLSDKTKPFVEKYRAKNTTKIMDISQRSHTMLTWFSSMLLSGRNSDKKEARRHKKGTHNNGLHGCLRTN